MFRPSLFGSCALPMAFHALIFLKKRGGGLQKQIGEVSPKAMSLSMFLPAACIGLPPLLSPV